MTRPIHRILRRTHQIRRRAKLAVCGGAALTLAVVSVGAIQVAAILQSATGTKATNTAQAKSGGVDLFNIVNQLLGPALWIVVGLAPLAIAWGAGAMIFGGRHGPQIMGSAIVAVVLVAAAKGIAA